jgi:ABC-type phosphate transport system substrate-binding protein
MPSFRFHLFAVYFTCLSGFALPVFAEEQIAIITQRNSTITSIDLETLKRVYLRKQELDNNSNRWIPLNLPSSHELRQAVSKILFHKRPEDLEEFWNEQYFQGISPPKVLASEEAVLRFVTITPGAIGYVHKHQLDDRVKVLTFISASSEN